jgi:5-methylcytosine-specific restriction endonuclease McrA
MNIKEAVNRRIERIRHLPYKEYLETDYWKELKKRVLQDANYTCSFCHERNLEMQVHHRSYEHKGYFLEELKDLIVLCEDCHDNVHLLRRASIENPELLDLPLCEIRQYYIEKKIYQRRSITK